MGNTVEDVVDGKDFEMVNEKKRLDTFTNWPFKQGPCAKENVSTRNPTGLPCHLLIAEIFKFSNFQMAAAGFYATNTPDGPDGVRSFCCFKELDSWDPEDDPW